MNVKKEVLFVSISAPPKNAPESLQAGKYLKYLAQSNNVTLVTSKIAGGWRPEDESLKLNLKDVKRIIEFPIWPNRVMYHLVKKLFPFLLQPDEDIPFAWRWKKIKSLLNKKPAVIYSRSTPLSSHFLAYKMRQAYNVPWFMHLSDPWVDNPYNKYSEAEKSFNIKWEKVFFETADKITFTSEKTLTFYQNKYPLLTGKFIVLPNVYDPDDLQTSIPEGGETKKLTLVHTGRLYESRSALTFLEALKTAVSTNPAVENNIRVVFAGFCDAVHEKAFKSFPSPCLSYLGPVSFKDSVNLQNNADVLIAIDSKENDPRFSMFFPSKLLDYFLTRKMIVGITTKKSTTEELIHGKYGLCFTHSDKDAITDFIVNLSLDPERNLLKQYSNYSPPEEYNVKINVALLDKLFENVATIK